MAYLSPKSEYNSYRYIASANLSDDYTCFLFTPRVRAYGAHIHADTDRYRIKSTGKERWEVYDLKEGMALNVDYMTKTFADAYDLLCNHINNSPNNE